jgi:putative FmdB family regulatory protein
MPLYEYKCKKCHHHFEKIQSFSARHVKKCPECGGPIEQVITAPTVQFKGSGWYVNDYAKGKSPTGSSSNGESSKDSGKDSDSKSESKNSEEKSKSEDKPKAEKSEKSEKKKAEKK